MNFVNLELENKEILSLFNRTYEELMQELGPEERKALVWFRQGLRAQDYSEKQICYQKTREILGNFVLR